MGGRLGQYHRSWRLGGLGRVKGRGHIKYFKAQEAAIGFDHTEFTGRYGESTLKRVVAGDVGKEVGTPCRQHLLGTGRRERTVAGGAGRL